ncbi:Lar family restriction alleviation protein [Candidatus Saccharibacteria bacterium]|nr:Lar family restriction alleviation protein [Candidatus Saccharibacteria bacterium]
MRTKPNPCPKCGSKVKVITNMEKSKGKWYIVIKCHECGYKTPAAWQKKGESVKELAERAIGEFNK